MQDKGTRLHFFFFNKFFSGSEAMLYCKRFLCAKACQNDLRNHPKEQSLSCLVLKECEGPDVKKYLFDSGKKTR